MQPFLDRLSVEIIKKYSENLSSICIVFPSRRAGIFFRKYLSQKINKPVWSPAVLSIQDFISKLSDNLISDKLILIFELYEVYKAHGNNESFDKFYPWGEMLLNDFDDIDKNLVDYAQLFKIIREFREVEERFNFSFGDIETFKKFWNTFSNTELTQLQDQFIETWKVVAKVYSDFRRRLEEKNLAYEGMAYRKIYEGIRSKKLNIEWDKIIFAGFNNFNRAEDEIITELIKLHKAELYWDADEYYINDTIQEAGTFLRKNFRKLVSIPNKKGSEQPNWIENNLSQSFKNIKIIGAPLLAGESKALGEVLQGLISETIPEGENTAIVLPDENMLMPVLYSIPEEIDKLNVTMGYPLKNSPLYNLVKLLKDLQGSKKTSANSTVFYHKNVLEILMHPYIKFSGTSNIYKLVNEIKEYNIIYVSEKKLNHVSELTGPIFKPIATVEQAFNYLYEIINNISSSMENSVIGGAKFESEYLYSLLIQLNRLKDMAIKYSAEITIEMFWKLLLEVLKTVRIPFTGEPLEGLQIMGLLETRALDFDNIFILSMNEGIMPKGNTQSSFIPYNLRKSFKLPTYEDEDCAYAYYFYRLLQRAKNIYLIYNTEVGELNSGEKSRFIMQIENELVIKNKNISLENYVFQTDIGIQKHKEITVLKDESVIEKLKSRKYFSATALSNYITCSLQFYYRRVAGLKEDESIDDVFSGAALGSIFHQISETLYKEYEGKTVTKKEIESIKVRLEKDYDKIWNNAFETLKELEGFNTNMKGKNLLLKRVVRKLIEKILENDCIETPFKILEVEKELRINLPVNIESKKHDVELLGKLDRIEKKNNDTRIIDYKTGYFKLQTQGKKSDEEYFTLIFSEPDYKENFQQYFYAYLYSQTNKNSQVSIGIYPLRSLSNGINFFEDGNITKERLELFGEYLNKLIEDIFNHDIPFAQTPDIDKCTWCPFKGICYRE